MYSTNNEKNGNGLGDLYSLASNQRFSNERHIPLIVNGRVKLGEFVGPGTHIKYRLQNDIQPISEVDKIAQTHDLRYVLSENKEDVRYADNKVINRLEYADTHNLDNFLNIKMTKLAMKSKRLFEDVGIWSEGSYSDMKGNALDENDKKIYKNKLNSLEQQGYGN